MNLQYISDTRICTRNGDKSDYGIHDSISILPSCVHVVYGSRLSADHTELFYVAIGVLH